MNTASLILIVIAGLVVSIWASQRAVNSATSAALGLGIPPFLLGAVLLAIGTDLPEMANSISASWQGQGDINIGDSIGSAVAQATLVLGLFPFFAGTIVTGKRRVPVIGGLTVGILLFGAWLLSDGYFSRNDAFSLMAAWMFSSIVVYKALPPRAEAAVKKPPEHPVRGLAVAMFFLGLVGVGAWFAIDAFVQLAENVGAPKYVISFFVLALGTSLPELVVNVTALKAGQRDMAIGGVLGATLVDASLSMAAGPAIHPTSVTADFAMRGNIAAAVAILIVTILIGSRRKHDRVSGAVLIALYAMMIPVLIG